MKTSRLITLVVLAAFGGILAAGAPWAQTKDPIKVGLIQPLSGPIAAAGSYITNGAKIAAVRSSWSSRTTSPTRPRPAMPPRSSSSATKCP